MRASGVFTGTTNSPSRWPRQSFDRYAIRAGRNLPDKEFRSSCLFCFQSRWTLSYATCVHRRSYRPDLFNALWLQVFALRHQAKNLSEPREVDSLLRFQRMLFKEGNDPFVEVIQPPNPICHPVTVVRPNYPAAKEFLQRVK